MTSRFMFSLIKLKHVVQDQVKVELEAASALPLEHRLGDHRLDLADARVPPQALHLALELHQDHPRVVVLSHQLPAQRNDAELFSQTSTDLYSFLPFKQSSFSK